MAFQQYFMQGRRSVPAQGMTCPEKTSACFDCCICLDFARDPVVTLCGHLYCWPCIYKWLESQNASLDSLQFPQCPVCKSQLSEKSIIPLYGRGVSLSEPDYEANAIPPRPPANGTERGFTSHDSYPNSHDFSSSEGDPLLPRLNDVTRVAPSALSSHPEVGMLGEMVSAREFGNTASFSTYPNSYHSVGSSSSRLRRLEAEADRSLSRIYIFLFCCFILCLILF